MFRIKPLGVFSIPALNSNGYFKQNPKLLNVLDNLATTIMAGRPLYFVKLGQDTWPSAPLLLPIISIYSYTIFKIPYFEKTLKFAFFINKKGSLKKYYF